MKLNASRDFQSTIIGSVSKGDDLTDRVSEAYGRALIEAGVVVDLDAPATAVGDDQGDDAQVAADVAEGATSTKRGRKPKAE